MSLRSWMFRHRPREIFTFFGKFQMEMKMRGWLKWKLIGKGSNLDEILRNPVDVSTSLRRGIVWFCSSSKQTGGSWYVWSPCQGWMGESTCVTGGVWWNIGNNLCRKVSGRKLKLSKLLFSAIYKSNCLRIKHSLVYAPRTPEDKWNGCNLLGIMSNVWNYAS